MAAFLLSDLPRSVLSSEYQATIDRLLQRITTNEDVVAVYAIGGVSAPGISDLDFVAVFPDNYSSTFDIRRELSQQEKYLLIHSFYGITQTEFSKAPSYSYFHPYRLLSGTELIDKAEIDFNTTVQTQVALEYLLKFYISLHLQHAYRLIRVRSILLNAKGVLADLKYLLPLDSSVDDFTKELMDLRSSWLDKEPPLKEFQSWYFRFSEWYFPLVESVFIKHPFYLPQNRVYTMGKNTALRAGSKLSVNHRGILAPFLHHVLGKRYFNVLNRINRFDFTVPFQSDHLPHDIEKYFDYTLGQRAYNSVHLPHYLPLASSLHLK